MKAIKRKVGAGLVLVGGSVASAHAAVDAAVTTAIEGIGTDAAVIGAAMLIVIVGIKAFKMVRRAL